MVKNIYSSDTTVNEKELKPVRRRCAFCNKVGLHKVVSGQSAKRNTKTGKILSINKTRTKSYKHIRCGF